MTTAKHGWVTIYPHIETPAYRDEDGNLVLYDTLKEARQELADDVLCHLVQYKDGERRWEEIDWGDEVDVRYAHQLPDGRTAICFDETPSKIEYVHHPGSEDLVTVGYDPKVATLIAALKGEI